MHPQQGEHACLSLANTASAIITAKRSECREQSPRQNDCRAARAGWWLTRQQPHLPTHTCLQNVLTRGILNPLARHQYAYFAESNSDLFGAPLSLFFDSGASRKAGGGGLTEPLLLGSLMRRSRTSKQKKMRDPWPSAPKHTRVYQADWEKEQLSFPSFFFFFLAFSPMGNLLIGWTRGLLDGTRIIPRTRERKQGKLRRMKSSDLCPRSFWKQ